MKTATHQQANELARSYDKADGPASGESQVTKRRLAATLKTVRLTPNF